MKPRHADFQSGSGGHTNTLDRTQGHLLPLTKRREATPNDSNPATFPATSPRPCVRPHGLRSRHRLQQSGALRDEGEPPSRKIGLAKRPWLGGSTSSTSPCCPPTAGTRDRTQDTRSYAGERPIRVQIDCSACAPVLIPQSATLWCGASVRALILLRQHRCVQRDEHRSNATRTDERRTNYVGRNPARSEPT